MSIINYQNNQKSNYTWLIFQISVLILPLFPIGGELGLFVVLIAMARSRSRRDAARPQYKIIISNPFNWGWLILTVWLIINSFLADRPSFAWLGLANFLPFFALFIAISHLINTPHKLLRLAWLLVVPSVAIVVLGLGQLYFNWSSPQLVATILGWELIDRGVYYGRMSSVFIHPNFLAIYLSFTFILSLGLWLTNLLNKNRNKYNLVVLSIILITNSIGLLLANSRNSWLIVFLVCLAFAIYLRLYWIVSIITTITTVIFYASFGNLWGQQGLRKIIPELIWGRLSDKIYPNRPVETLRITQWQFCWLKIQERPFRGWGLRNFTPLYLEQTNFWYGHPHNLFIMLGVEIGVLATGFLCVMVGRILFGTTLLLLKRKPRFNREERLIIFTYLLTFASCILFNIFDVTIFDLRVNTISWIILAAIAGVGQIPRSQDANYYKP